MQRSIPSDEALFRRLNSEEINALPQLKYDGPVELLKTEQAASAAVKELAAETLLGFDTETRAAFRKGESYNPSLLQLCSSSKVYIFQLRGTGLCADMRRLLANPEIIKAGVAVKRDIQELQQLNSFKAAGFVDLGETARKAGMHHHGLRGLVALLLRGRLSKQAQRSNWARRELSPYQVAYAATDAWVSRKLYLIMGQLGIPFKFLESNRQP